MVDCDTMTRGIYIVWWDKDVDLSAKADRMLDSMIVYRNTCLNELAMADPPNTADGYYYNIYIHRPGDANDFFFPQNWGNGQGTDNNGYPFLTYPEGVLADWVNISHETFHVFQYSATAPGFAYAGDSQWYIEGSANWFAARNNDAAPRVFIEAESLVKLPHIPLWLSYDNYPTSYPQNWQRYVHQYALALYLYYLTDVAGIPDSIITSGLYSGTSELPQEYFYNQLGSSVMRDHFIDFAAHLSNDFDFISPLQRLNNENEWNSYADPNDENEFTETYLNSGSGAWYRPADTSVTHAWSYNTYKLLNDSATSYTFELKGDPTGSYGDLSYFQGKVVVRNSQSGTSFHDLNMTTDQQGSLTLNVSPSDTALYFILAAMPEVFEDINPTFQQFSYEMQITQGNTTAISDLASSHPKKEIARYNLSGQKIHKEVGGFQLILFDDGSTKKEFRLSNY